MSLVIGGRPDGVGQLTGGVAMPALEPLQHHARDESPSRIDLLADPALADDDAAQVFDYLLGRAPRRRVLAPHEERGRRSETMANIKRKPQRDGRL